MNSQPIGVFDSGLGGLTVAKELINKLPNENIIYLGDTARVPYGTRTYKTIKLFAKEQVDFMLSKKVKIIVVACNTMSAVALTEIKKRAGKIPVINVIAPTIISSVQYKNRSKLKIGILGTKATISSNVYEKKLKKLDTKIKVYSRMCPLFVPVIEEGFADHSIANDLIKEYLGDLKNKELDALILGCTHYPLILSKINLFLNNKVSIIDSAKPTAEYLENFLDVNDMKNSTKNKSNNNFYFTEISSSTENMVKLVFEKNYRLKLLTAKIN